MKNGFKKFLATAFAICTFGIFQNTVFTYAIKPTPAEKAALRFFTQTYGCDSVNAYLRGDLYTPWRFGRTTMPFRPKEPATFGTNLFADEEEYHEIGAHVNNLITLINRNKLGEMTLYRGICLQKVLNSVENNNPANKTIIADALNKIKSGISDQEIFLGKDIIYQAKDVSATSKEKDIAESYALSYYDKNKGTPVILEIEIKKDTTHGYAIPGSKRSEVLLLPNQKIRINSAEKIVLDCYCEGILLKCETIS